MDVVTEPKGRWRKPVPWRESGGGEGGTSRNSSPGRTPAAGGGGSSRATPNWQQSDRLRSGFRDLYMLRSSGFVASLSRSALPSVGGRREERRTRSKP